MDEKEYDKTEEQIKSALRLADLMKVEEVVEDGYVISMSYNFKTGVMRFVAPSEEAVDYPKENLHDIAALFVGLNLFFTGFKRKHIQALAGYFPLTDLVTKIADEISNPSMKVLLANELMKIAVMQGTFDD